MPVIKDIDSRVFPMPSRIEITFGKFMEGTIVPDISKPIVKYFFQDYDLKNMKAKSASIIQLKETDLTEEDLDTVLGIFVKYFDEAYKKKYNIE